MNLDSDATAATDDDRIQQLITLLLGRRVSVSYVLTRLHGPAGQHLSSRCCLMGTSPAMTFRVTVFGLIEAVDRFDAGQPIDLAGIAVPATFGQLEDDVRDHTGRRYRRSSGACELAD
jgi:hypothetical protein